MGIRKNITWPTDMHTDPDDIIHMLGFDPKQVKDKFERYDPMHGWQIAFVTSGSSYLAVCDESKRQITLHH